MTRHPGRSGKHKGARRPGHSGKHKYRGRLPATPVVKQELVPPPRRRRGWKSQEQAEAVVKQEALLSVPPVVKQDAAMPVLPVVKKEAISRRASRACNKPFGCGMALCDKCYPPGDALGRRRL